MKELIYAAPSKLEWREGMEPVITDPCQALVRPIASAFCDLDRRIRAGLTPFQPGDRREHGRGAGRTCGACRKGRCRPSTPVRELIACQRQ